eukprot:TRINITY_DN45416_c0_g1_i1.p1 TRINITY_DN45416_c0_g1~~TRINITY_DN45416_c0_g1_i1.p1  ORF type:complete len:324 (-),score=27.82 TRINITY_DN45416_c0_g1_i1:211-1131(-)
MPDHDEVAQLPPLRQRIEPLWVPGSLCVGVIVGAFAPISGDSLHSEVGSRICTMLGWCYSIAWSVSFWPQVVQNYAEKSVAGLSVEFQLLNLLGFGAYFCFNAANYYSSHIQSEYKKQNGGNDSAVELYDVAFSAHATLVTSMTCLQIILYRHTCLPLQPAERILRYAVFGGTAVALVVIAALAVLVGLSSEKFLDWLTFLSYLSVMKVVISCFKYCPQVWLNCRLKSTEGWSIHNVLLDFTGGTLSVAELVLRSWLSNDWTKITGDVAKFLLGFVSMVFDVIFMAQHYCLFRNSRIACEQRELML